LVLSAEARVCDVIISESFTAQTGADGRPGVKGGRKKTARKKRKAASHTLPLPKSLVLLLPHPCPPTYQLLCPNLP
jgi:hypothetical protein